MRPYRVKPYTVPSWIHRALLSLRPAERLPVSKWAEKWRVLPDTNAIPGPFRNSVTPYLAEIMDAFSNEDVERIAFVKPTQVGGTTALENMLASAIDQDPAPTMIVYPLQGTGRADGGGETGADDPAMQTAGSQVPGGGKSKAKAEI